MNEPVQLVLRFFSLVLVSLIGLWAPVIGANELTPEQVLQSSQRYFPEILQGLAKRELAQGQVLTADGAFDLVFSADGYSRASGYYDGRVLSGSATQDLGRGGVSLYSKYRISGGSFPIYEDEYFTNSGGEFKVGVLFALLRDRSIDDQRFARRDAALAVEAANLQLLLTKLGVQQRALISYWRWVTAGSQISVYQGLLSNAIDRESGLSEQVRSGAQAKISLTENRQNITRRQALVTAAKREFAKATNNLSFYYRGVEGSPVRPTADQLPQTAATFGAIAVAGVADVESVDAIGQSALARANAQRPGLRLLDNTIERTLQRIALDENSLKPKLNLELGLARDVGGIAEGGRSRLGTDTVIGLEFSVPLQRRAARGQLQQSKAKLEAQRQQQRQLQDEIEIELRNIVLELNAARELAELARLEVGQARALRDAERTRFASGASDFFLVNLREQAAADAERRHLYALLDARVARINYDSAVVDLERLGLDPSRP